MSSQEFSGEIVLFISLTSLIELKAVFCLWMADACSKLKVSLLSVMLNVLKGISGTPEVLH